MNKITVIILGITLWAGCSPERILPQGLVITDDGIPIAEAMIKGMGTDFHAESNLEGQFQLKHAQMNEMKFPTLKVTKEGYLDRYYAMEDLSGVKIEMVGSGKLAETILNDDRLNTVRSKALELLSSNEVTAGGMYPEIWIRDLNTFVEAFLESGEPEVQRATIRKTLLKFYQGQDKPYQSDDGKPEFSPGSIADQYHGDNYKKISVETDQETSLVQATCKYIKRTADYDFLNEVVDGLTVRQRIDKAFDFLLLERQDPSTGLIFGAVTVDWGDISPDVNTGVGANLRKGESHIAVDVYDNAMMLLALENYLEVLPDTIESRQKWEKLLADHRERIMVNLWDGQQMKFKAHVYPTNDLGYLVGSPWFELKPDNFVDGTPFDESKMYFHGGTGIAILANLLSKEQIAWSVQMMRHNVALSTAQSIGLTVYPPYPQNVWTSDYTRSRIGSQPYYYQNGGDWTWFGARIVLGLVNHGFVTEAYAELEPMLDRVIEHGGFYEWWHPNSQGGEPIGRGDFRGSAGVLFTAIEGLQQWARNQPSN